MEQVFFTGRMPFLPPNQQHQSTKGAVSSAAEFCENPSQCKTNYMQSTASAKVNKQTKNAQKPSATDYNMVPTQSVAEDSRMLEYLAPSSGMSTTSEESTVMTQC